ncbi:hypothetical protein [Fluviispira sanaruensis]|nr:hypothetical protein [Fluviispira sanaruensis]
MNFFKKYKFLLFFFLTLVILIVGKSILIEEEKSEIIISSSEVKSNNSKIEVLKNERNINKNIADEATKNEFENFVNSTIPSNINEAQQEVNFLEKKLKDENAVERLNNNSVSTVERQNYQQIYKRLSLLSKYIMEKDYENLSIKVSDYEKELVKNLEDLGVKKRN